MTANEFLGQLEQCLSGLQNDERENAMAYYREYFMEAGEENEDEAAAHLGSPQSVAERIISEMGESIPVSPSENESSPAPEKNDTSTAGRTLIGALVILLGFPIWVTILALWFSLAVALISLIFVMGVSTVAAPVQGVMDIFNGYIGMGIFNIGSGVLCLGLTMLLVKPVITIIVKSFKGLCKLVLLLFGKKA